MALSKIERRSRIKRRIRKKISGSAIKPRLSVFRSNKHFYAQIIDDLSGNTLATASSKDKDLAEKISGNKVEQAKQVGAYAATKFLEKGIKEVVFDRNGYLYHGRVKAFADAAREAGLNI